MAKIYVNQPWELTITSAEALTGTTQTRIYYQKPLGTTGYWDVTTSGLNFTKTISGTDNNEFGDWKFQTSAIFPGATEATRGETVIITIEKAYQ